jgi:hypothetical protein
MGASDSLSASSGSESGTHQSGSSRPEDVAIDNGALTAYRFEAENAVIEGTGGIDRTHPFEHASARNSYLFHKNFSGNICVVNASGFSYRFDFVGDKNVKVYLTLRTSCFDGERYLNGENITDYFDITCNGVAAEETEGISEEYESPIDGEKKYDMADVAVIVELKKGENSIVIADKQKDVSLNLDYIQLDTSATVEGFTPTGIASADSFVRLVSRPTYFQTGELWFADTPKEGEMNAGIRRYTLNYLADSEYKTDKNGDYVLELCGKTYYLTDSQAKTHTATIDGEAAFDGGEKSVSLKTNAVLPAVTVAEGKKLKGWLVNGESYPADGFIMPDEDVTLTPVFAEKYTVTIEGDGVFEDGSTVKKLFEGDAVYAECLSDKTLGIVGWKSEKEGYLDERDEVGLFYMPAHDITVRPITAEVDKDVAAGTGRLKVGGIADGNYMDQNPTGSLLIDGGKKQSTASHTVRNYKNEDYTVLSNITGSGYSRIKTAYKVESDITYMIRYKFINLGQEDITFSVWQVNSGGKPTGNFHTEVITLKPGESAVSRIVFTFQTGKNTPQDANSNLLSVLQVESDCAGTDLGIAAYIMRDYVAP